jgi:hypothetical protein
MLTTAPVLTITPIPKLLPTTAPKKTIYAEAYIEVRLVKEGEVTK